MYFENREILRWQCKNGVGASLYQAVDIIVHYVSLIRFWNRKVVMLNHFGKITDISASEMASLAP
jgi:hypothetical protein